MDQEYALYKGNDLLSIGTLKEIADQLNIKEKTVYFYKTPTYKKRTSEEKSRRLVKI